FVLLFPAIEHFVSLHSASQVADIFFKHLANLIEHPPRGLVGNAQFSLKLFRRDSATSARHQIHRVIPEMQRRRRFVVDGSGGRMEMVAASRTAPRLTLLRRSVALERSRLVALRAGRVDAIRRETRTPEMLQASIIVRELSHELRERAA